MKTILKKVLGLSLAAVIAVSTLAGCTGGKNDNSGDGAKGTNASAMGRYLEEEMKLPEGMSKILQLTKLSDGRVRMLASDGENKTLIWDSEDGGSTWTKVSDLPEELTSNRAQVMTSAISSNGESAIAVMTGSDTGGPTVLYWVMDKDGNAKKISIELPQDNNQSTQGEGETTTEVYTNAVSKFSYTDDGKLIGIDFENNIHQIDPQTGKIVKSFSGVAKGSYIMSFQAIGNTLVVVTDKEVQLFDLSTGNQMEKDAALNDQLLKGKDETALMQLLRGTGEPFVFTKGDGDKSIFFGSNDGMYSHTIGGNLVEQVINGDLNSMGNPEYSFISIAALEDGSFLMAGAEGYDVYKLYKYTYSKDTPATPSKEVKVYSLEENAEIRQAIAFFQKNNPDIFVNLEVGLSGGDAITVSDALRTLNTNILAGKGPDVLIVDGMPVKSYMEKGLLTDLTEILKQVESSEGLIESIKGTYSNGDKIQAIPTRFKIPLIQGSKANIENINDLSSMAEQIQKLKAENPDKGILGNLKAGDLVEKLYASNSAAWLKEDGTLNEDQLKEFFTLLKQIYESDKHETEDESIQMLGEYGESSFYNISGGINSLLGNKNMLNLGLLPEFSQYIQVVTANKKMGDGVVKLLNGQTENAFVPMTTVGISSKSADTESAGKFVAFLLSKDAQKINQGGGLPVNKSAFDEGLEAAANLGDVDVSSNDQVSGLTEVSESDINDLKAMVESLTTPSVVDDVIKENIKEQAEQCVSGSITSEEAVKNVMQKINLYLSE